MKTNNYDTIAGSYDFLSRLVFFRAQVNAQIEQLKHIQAGTSILIVGGGTGWILEEITKIHSGGLKITYIEVSQKMLELARKRNFGVNEVQFVLGSIENYIHDGEYDVIHTAFLFDNFEESRAARIFHQLLKQLKAGGLWLYTDFRIGVGPGTWWKKALLQLMYAFFSKIAHVEAVRLPQMDRLFANSGLPIIEQKEHFKGFIDSIIFQKSMKLPTFMENLES